MCEYIFNKGGGIDYGGLIGNLIGGGGRGGGGGGGGGDQGMFIENH